MRAPARCLGIAAMFLAMPSVAWSQTALLEAVMGNDTDAALAALNDPERNADIDAPGPDGTTALIWAVYNDNELLVGELLSAGASVDSANEFGATPMSEAATVGNAAVIGQLLAAGVDPNAAGADGETALMVVARSGRVDAARVLIEAGADVNARETWRNQTALMWSAAQKHPEMVQLLIEHGAEVDARSAVNQWPRQVTGEPRRMYRPFGGLTPLMFAAREGCVDCARHLIEAGANVNLADPKNVTPLFLAIENFHFDTAKVLLDARRAQIRISGTGWDARLSIPRSTSTRCRAAAGPTGRRPTQHRASKSSRCSSRPAPTRTRSSRCILSGDTSATTVDAISCCRSGRRPCCVRPRRSMCPQCSC